MTTLRAIRTLLVAATGLQRHALIVATALAPICCFASGSMAQRSNAHELHTRAVALEKKAIALYQAGSRS
jgi:hypothetical protein